MIRTLDLGADKLPSHVDLLGEANPALGIRGVRLYQRRRELFRTQLRALLRAGAYGRLRILLPMVCSMEELEFAKAERAEVRKELEAREGPIGYAPELGVMVETPAAAIITDLLVRNVDFLSIGTNDLLQYTLAVDRGNELVSTLYSSADPAVLRLIRTVIQDAHKAQIDLSVCGEVASEPEYVMLLLGMGVRTFSLAPPMIPEIKQIIRSVTIEDCNQVARKVLGMNSERHISSYLRTAARKILPEAF